MTEPLEGLTEVAWSTLRCAYGSADRVPSFIRDAASEDPERQDSGIAELWQNVWHQGTVYDCTPSAVPFLVALVADERLPDANRAELALLLASIASATSLAVGEPMRPFVVAAIRGAEDPVPDRELDHDCRQALANASGLFDQGLTAGPPATQAGLVAAAATIAQCLSPTARAALTNLAHSDDVYVANAAQLTLALADEQTIAETDLVARTAIDEEAADYLTYIDDWPTNVRAVELVQELCERSVVRRIS
jgi:hypothetical protein